MGHFERPPGGTREAIQTRLTADKAAERFGEDYATAVEEVQLLTEIGATHDQKLFEAAVTTPVLFGAAVANFGVAQLLDVLIEHAPAPGPREAAEGEPRAVGPP